MLVTLGIFSSHAIFKQCGEIVFGAKFVSGFAFGFPFHILYVPFVIPPPVKTTIFAS
ncbi:MAG: hypothetical protein JRF71_15535 [Deltaproteobacteria bacterium]|nr:hypothetical protein [Deltaproteobacteria bacterium]